MKKITTLILCIIFFNISYSQTTQHVVDSIFQHINKSPITSNIFIDRVFPSSGVQEFNQGIRKDTSNFMHFKQVWSDLNRASYLQNFSTIAQFKLSLKNKNHQKNTVPIGVINTEFHQSDLGTNASNANVNYSNGFMRNKVGKIPFIKKQATVIAPLVASARGSNITFKIDNDFILHKFGKQIKNLVLQTNNTSFTLISNNALTTYNLNTNYTNSGIKVLKFIITFNDNSTKTTYGSLKIFVPNTYSAKGFTSVLDTISADSDLHYQGYDENSAYQGQNEYRIYYDNINNDQIINKPIFIMDGYDPGDIRKIERTDIGHDSDKSIYQLMNFGNNNLVEDLRNDGYDVIIVNHHKYTSNGKEIDGGSDYIQRNAYTFISLLRHINSIKQGNEENVVIGPSMGGLITRYALAYMEQKLALTGDTAKWNHETRLWVSFDSPHQGANIPFGVQKGIQYYADVIENEGAKDFIKQLDQPAPKQMLVNHYTNDTKNINGAPNFRNRFQNELDNLGMPQNLRKIALVNGSISGSLNGISKNKYLHITSVPFLLVAFLGADVKVLTDYYHSSNEKNNLSSEVFFGRTNIKYSVFGLFTISYTFDESQKYLYANSNGSYDISPGGYFYAQQQLAQESSGIDLGNFFTITNSYINDPTHSFIPTKSALAYSGSNTLDEAIGNKDRVCTGETPFDSYFAPQDNEEHIELSQESVAWLTKEIENNHQQPTVYIDAATLTLTGDVMVCSIKTNTFSINIPSCSKNTVWAVSNGLQIISQNNNTITVAPTNTSVFGVGFITATIDGVTNELFKSVWVGLPPNDNTLKINKLAGYELYSQQWTKLKASFPTPSVLLLDSNTIAPFIYEWNIPSSYIKTNTDTSIIDIKPYSSGQINIGARAKNSCGCTNWSYQLFNVLPAPGSGGGPIFPVQQ